MNHIEFKEKINTVICGDALSVLRTFPDECVDMCCSSPPYWGLRNYGVEGQLGLEKTPEEYVAKMVEIFREVKRVMKTEASLWLNLGDSYAASSKGSGGLSDKQDSNAGSRYEPKKFNLNRCGLKPKDLCGIPWRVAFALQADGWWLRQDIIWHKPNPMPESVTDRCTKAHEYIFLMTKRPKYYYDADAIRESQNENSIARYKYEFNTNDMKPSGERPNTGENLKPNPLGRNKRSVWTVPTAAFSQAHFATFAPKLIEPCILAGCPEWVCTKCGKARERVIEKPIPPKDAFTETRREGNDEHIGGCSFSHF